MTKKKQLIFKLSTELSISKNDICYLTLIIIKSCASFETKRMDLKMLPLQKLMIVYLPTPTFLFHPFNAQKNLRNVFRLFFSVNFTDRKIYTRKTSEHIFRNFLCARGMKKKRGGWEEKLSKLMCF
jgi:hypothetical protein